jgi:hypothetical protein
VDEGTAGLAGPQPSANELSSIFLPIRRRVLGRIEPLPNVGPLE